MSFNFDQAALQPLVPESCWAIYKVGQSYHIEAARVTPAGTILDYKPLGPALARRIGRALVGRNETAIKFSGNMSNVVKVELDSNNMNAIWYRPPQIWMCHYAQGIKITNGKRPMPGLVFKVSSCIIYVYAYKRCEWLGDITSLYHAPIHNIYEDGRMCISLDNKWHNGDKWESWRNRIESQVFGTLKSEIHFEGYKTKDHDLTKLHRMLPEMKEFPDEWLLPTKRSLKIEEK